MVRRGTSEMSMAGIRTMNKKANDVLSRIPSASAIRGRLQEMQVEVSKLRILLEVAERIEAVRPEKKEAAHV